MVTTHQVVSRVPQPTLRTFQRISYLFVGVLLRRYALNDYRKYHCTLTRTNAARISHLATVWLHSKPYENILHTSCLIKYRNDEEPWVSSAWPTTAHHALTAEFMTIYLQGKSLEEKTTQSLLPCQH